MCCGSLRYDFGLPGSGETCGPKRLLCPDCKGRGTGRKTYKTDEGTNVQELMENAEILKAVLEGNGESGMGEVVWKVPKFSYGTKMDRGDSLKALGIRKAFEDGDFSNMTSSQAFISSVRQETHVGMDENGVEAAAFTEIMYAGAAMPVGRAEMLLDRPFLYVIKNRGQILFIGVCEDPSV